MPDVEIDVLFPDPVITDVVVDRIGPQGVGIPAGGSTNQRLAKSSNSDFAFQWVNPDASLAFADSISDSGGTITLKNDSSTPGASKYYGTNSGSTLGYFSLPSSAVMESVFNVKDYGALGNGSNDDSTSIQAALDACDSAGGGIVYFPKGTYNIGSGIIVGSGNTFANQKQSHTILQGAGNGATTISHSGADSQTAVWFNHVVGGGIKDLTIYRNAGALGTGTTIGLETSGPTGSSGTTTNNCVLDHVSIMGFNICWKCYGHGCCSSEITSRNLTLGYGDTGFQSIDLNALNFVFEQLIIAHCSVVGMYCFPGVHVFGGASGNNLLDFYFAGTGSNTVSNFRSETAGTFVDNHDSQVTITDCVVENVSNIAIHNKGAMELRNCIIKGDVQLDDAGDLVISSCTVYSTKFLKVTAFYGHQYSVTNCQWLQPNGSGLVFIGFKVGLLQGDWPGTASVLETVSVPFSTARIGFFDKVPIAQAATGGAASTFTANTSAISNDTATWDGYTIGQIVKALRNYGLLA